MVATKTHCTFPFMYNASIVYTRDIYNESQVADLSKDDCTSTYGEVLDPFYTVMRYVMIVVGGGFFVSFSLQLIRLAKYAKMKKMAIWKLVQFRFYLLGSLLGGTIAIEGIDLFSFQNLLPYHMYYLLDEIIPVAYYVFLLECVKFWHSLLTLGNRSSDGKSRMIGSTFGTVLYIFITTLNFLGFIILSFFDTKNFFLYEGLKLFFAGVICHISCLLIYQDIRKLNVILSMGQDLTAAPPARATTDAAGANDVQSTASSNKSKAAKSSLQQFNLKVNRALGLFFVSGLIEYMVAIVAILKPSWIWFYSIYELIDPFQVVLKLLFFTGLIVLRYSFAIPAHGTASSRSTKHSSPIRNDQASNKGNRDETNALAVRAAPGSTNSVGAVKSATVRDDNDLSHSRVADKPRSSRVDVVSSVEGN